MRILVLALAFSLQAPAVKNAPQGKANQPRAENATRPASPPAAPVAISSQRDTAVDRRAPADEGPKSTDWLIVGLTAVLAFLAYRQWVTSDKQREIMGRQTNLMREQYVATFRPKLIVRDLRLETEKKPDGVVIGVLRYTVANVGGSPARVVGGFQARRMLVKGTPIGRLPDTPDNILDGLTKRDLVIAGGGSETVTFRLDETLTPGLVGLWLERNDLIFFAHFVYVDDNGVKRRLGVLRRYVPETERFEVVNDPDYEYDD